MKFNSNKSAPLQKSLSALVLAIFLFGQVFAQTTAPAVNSLSATEKELADKITIETIKEYTAALAADDMQGRGTMQPGGDKAANWIAERFQKLGLKPLGDKGSYLQKINFKETLMTPDTSFKVGDENLKFGTEFGIAPFSAGIQIDERRDGFRRLRNRSRRNQAQRPRQYVARRQNRRDARRSADWNFQKRLGKSKAQQVFIFKICLERRRRNCFYRSRQRR